MDKDNDSQLLNNDKIIYTNGEYIIEEKDVKYYDENNMWRYFDLIALSNPENIVTLNEGKTSLKRVKKLEKYLNNAELWIKCESENPEGTFKDREASYVISKAKELGLKRIVFHSTGNTGRAYSLYAKKADIESYFFVPLSCMDKCNQNMVSDKNHIIAVDGKFSDVSKIAKAFARKNNIEALAPLHDKLEGKATIAYEQYEECPNATMFVQTIAGGYGIIGYLMGHKRIQLLENKEHTIPKIVAIQLEGNDTIKKAISKGLNNLTKEDMLISETPFEKTLQSTNPLKTYETVKNCIEETDGIIESVTVSEIESNKDIFETELKSLGIEVNYENEKSPFISFAGLIKLANNGLINEKDKIYFVLTGSGKKDKTMVKPDAIVKPTDDGYIVLECNSNIKEVEL